MDSEGRVTGMNVGQPEKSRDPTRPTEPPGRRERLSAGRTSTHQRFSRCGPVLLCAPVVVAELQYVQVEIYSAWY